MPWELGYAFLFIYGLERRALVDQTDRRLVFDEVLRLRDLYKQHAQASRSFELYTSCFLWFLVSRHPDLIDPTRVRRLLQSSGLSNEEHLYAALAWFAARQAPLPDWAAFTVAGELRDAQRSIVVHRVNDEFKKLFCRRYRERYGDGIVLNQNSRPRRCSYKPASAALAAVHADAPSAHLRGLAPLSALWNECIAELRKFSALRAKGMTPAVTVSAWEAMPPDLRATIDHPATESLCELINKSSDRQGRTICRASEVAAAAGLSFERRLTPAQGRKLCETLEHVGYCLEPDARLTGTGYEAEKRVSVLLRTAEGLMNRDRYNAATCMLRIGLAIAEADGHSQPDEVSLIAQQIDAAFGLSEEEVRRLQALCDLLLANGVATSSFGRIVKNLPRERRSLVGKLALALVASDGVVTRDELRAVRSCYGALGLDEAEIEETLRPLLAPADEPITVARAEEGAGPWEPIPIAPSAPAAPAAPQRTTTAKPEPSLRLNRDAIAAIMRETQEVAAILAEAMNTDGDAVPSITPTPPAFPSREPAVGVPDLGVLRAIAAPEVTSTQDPTLPKRYAAFFQALVVRRDWSVEEADALAREHGHMLSGAIEVLNEWAFDKYGNQIFLEEGDRLTVEHRLFN